MRSEEVAVLPTAVDWRRWHLDVQMGWKTSAQVQAQAEQECALLAALHDQGPPPVKGFTLAKRYLGLAKIPGLYAHLRDEWLTGDRHQKVVLCFESRDVGMGLRDALTDYHPVLLFKGTPAAQREKRLKQFQTRWQNRVAIVQLQTGLTLAAHAVYFVELSTDPTVNRVLAVPSDIVPIRLVTLTGTVDVALMRSRWEAAFAPYQRTGPASAR